MAKLFLKVNNEKGKIASLGGNEELDIEIMVGNQQLALLRVRRGDIPESDNEGWILYDGYDEPTHWIEDKQIGQKAQGEIKELATKAVKEQIDILGQL